MRYHSLPDVLSDVDLSDVVRIGVLVPEATTNLIANPSFERDTNGYTVSSGTLTRITEQQRAGAYSAKVTMNANEVLSYGTISLQSGTYTASVWLYGEAGRTYRLAIYANFTIVAETTVRAWGRWQRVSLTFVLAATTSLSLWLTNYTTGTFYTDAWQLEQKPYATTYCDGDTDDCYWRGTPHGSQSVRRDTALGGREYMFATLGFRIMTIAGLFGLLTTAVTTPLATGGSLYQDRRDTDATLTLTGRMDAVSPADFFATRSQLLSVLNSHRQVEPRPLGITYQPYDCDQPIGDQVIIPCVWQPDGGEMSNAHTAALSMTFQVYLPHLTSGQQGISLPSRQATGTMSYLAVRSSDGVWSNGFGASGGANATILALKRAPNGDLYAGGNFTAIGGVTTNYIARWNGTTWATLGSGTNGTVRDIQVAPNGDLYVTGDFTTAGGITVNRIAKYSNGTWSALGSGLNNTGNTIALDNTSNVYVGGVFTTAGGITVNRIAKWDGSVWSALGSGANTSVLKVLMVDTTLFVAGTFTTMNGITVNRITKYSNGTWSALGSGANDSIYNLAYRNGLLYALGIYSSIGSITTPMIATWNGTHWRGLGGGITASGPSANGVLMVDTAAQIYASGNAWTMAGTTPLIESFVRWNGASWIPPDIDFGGSGVGVWASESLLDGTLVFAHTDTGNVAQVAAVTTITNTGTTDSQPIFTIINTDTISQRLYQIVNVTTGDALYFNLQILPQEIITVDLRPATIGITSNQRGNLIGSVLDGSNLANWRILPGQNAISVFASSTNVQVTAWWDVQLSSLDDAVWRK